MYRCGLTSTEPRYKLGRDWGSRHRLRWKTTSPVVDGSTGNVFVGCSDGKIYGFTSAGAALPTATLTVGNGSATGGIVDPPLVDGTNGVVYAVSGNDGTNAVLVQAKTDFTSKVTATLGPGGFKNLHAPAFNDNYVANGSAATWLLYEVAPDNVGGAITLYGIGFSGVGRTMTAGTPVNADSFVIGAFEISPLTEFLTGTTDRLFESAQGNFSGNLASFDITSSFPPNTPPSPNATEGSGTTGIVVDNVSVSNQANSIYFGSLGAVGTNPNSAVKLTQSALQ